MSRQGFVFGKILERRSGAAGLLGRDDRRQTRYPAEGVPLTSRSGEDSITDEGGRMLKLFLVMALMFLPLSRFPTQGVFIKHFFDCDKKDAHRS